MNLEQHLEDIQARLKNNQYPNEQSISQGIILRILQAIHWPIYDTQLVMPEYSIGGRRVDFALCGISNKPTIFIEVKQPGKIIGANKQLFEYAFHAGIQFAIVTDGIEWHFYLPGEVGSYEERRVYKLDLIEREINESSFRFQRYLGFQSVSKGEALESARKDYKNISKQRQTKANLPIAWEKLIEEKDDMLIELLAEKVESLCGYRASGDQIIQFLYTLSSREQAINVTHNSELITSHIIGVEESKSKLVNEQKNIANRIAENSKKTIIKVTFKSGEQICCPKAADTMIEVIRRIGYDKVKNLGIKMYGCPIVSNKKMRADQYTWSQAEPNIYIFTHSNTDKKISQLHEISDALSLGLRIEKI